MNKTETCLAERTAFKKEKKKKKRVTKERLLLTSCEMWNELVKPFL